MLTDSTEPPDRNASRRFMATFGRFAVLAVARSLKTGRSPFPSCQYANYVMHYFDLISYGSGNRSGGKTCVAVIRPSVVATSSLSLGHRVLSIPLLALRLPRNTPAPWSWKSISRVPHSRTWLTSRCKVVRKTWSLYFYNPVYLDNLVCLVSLDKLNEPDKPNNALLVSY